MTWRQKHLVADVLPDAFVFLMFVSTLCLCVCMIMLLPVLARTLL